MSFRPDLLAHFDLLPRFVPTFSHIYNTSLIAGYHMMD